MEASESNHHSFQSLATFAVFLLLLTLNSCSETTTAPGEVRNSAKAATYNDQLSVEEQTNSIPFILSDHFAVLRADFSALKNSNYLSQVNWTDLEVALSQSIGLQNVDLDSIKSVWITLDRNLLRLEETLPFLMIVEFKQAPDRTKLAAALNHDGELEVGKRQEMETGFSYQLQSPTQLWVGDRVSIENTASGMDTNQSLIKQMEELQAKDIAGVLDFEVISGQLSDVIGPFGGMAMLGEYRGLFDFLKNVVLTVEADSENLAKLRMDISDQELAAKIAIQFQEAQNMLSGLPMFLGNQSNKAMHDSSTFDSLITFAENINTNQKLKIEVSDAGVEAQLDAAPELVNLLNQAFRDFRNQSELAQRLEHMEKIGQALEAYHVQFGHYPPNGPVETGADEMRPQFNWLTGLLPELGYQALYDQFQFDQPFDSEINSKLAKQIPIEFRSNDPSLQSEFQTRLKLAGDTGLWGKHATPKKSDLLDLPEWTALVFQSGIGQSWTSPNFALFVPTAENERAAIGEENGVLVLDANHDPCIVRDNFDAISAITSLDGRETLQGSDFILPAKRRNNGR